MKAIELIESFSKSTPTFELYSEDLKTQSAVERQLGIIGEAVNKFSKISETELENSQRIIGFRNRIIHAYDYIDATIVWAVLKNYLPALKGDVLSKLKD
ncbi:MAG: HepT-like ribonuclease domain-containing protein [Balneolaceae bacterium]